MKRVPIVVVATVIGAFAAGWVSAQGTRGAALTGQDYAEIEQLMAKYYQALDFEDRDMFESIWTEDAVYRINSLGQPVEGRDAIVGRTARPSTSGATGRTTSSSPQRRMGPAPACTGCRSRCRTRRPSRRCQATTTTCWSEPPTAGASRSAS